MKKMIMAAIAVLLIVVISVSATYAYLMDTEGVVNTFAVGDVDISLAEEEDEDGDGKHTFDNILPGHEYDKNPVVTVKANSEDCYLFVKVENNLSSVETATEDDTLVGQIAANGWTALDGVANVYYKTVTKTGEAQDFPVFSSFTVKEDADNADMQAVHNKTIEITAYAVQQVGIDSVEDAWTIAQDATEYERS